MIKSRAEWKEEMLTMYVNVKVDNCVSGKAKKCIELFGKSIQLSTIAFCGIIE